MDAEYGHSGGGIISTTLKSGTNEFHGNVFFTGRYPWTNAAQDSYPSPKIPATTRQNQYGKSAVFEGSGFAFYPNSTADTYVNPDTSKSGNPWASFLSGALGDPVDASWDWSGGSFIHQTIAPTPISSYWSYFANDDWKMTRNLTVTLGLRYEYEEPRKDTENRASRFVDLKAPNADLTAANPQIDGATQALISQYYSGPQYLSNGNWIFADKDHRGMWNSVANLFLPRLGFAYRLNDKTAINAGYSSGRNPGSSRATTRGRSLRSHTLALPLTRDQHPW